jgi:regulation of enolase protein 1 (concanavalin A-like superfamily)
VGTHLKSLSPSRFAGARPPGVRGASHIVVLAFVLGATLGGCGWFEPRPTSIDGWGNAYDPDGDCKFTVEEGRLRIAVPGTDHALAIERGQVNAPRVVREVYGDFIAQVKVSGAFPTGAVRVIERGKPFHGAGLLLWQDEQNYIRLERTEMAYGPRNTSGVGFEKRTGGKFQRLGPQRALNLDDGQAPTYLKLQRQGDEVRAAASTDGAVWVDFKPMTVDLPERVYIGVAAGHNTSSAFEPEFAELSIIPSPTL